ncbi:M16 family metallopeptidase [Alkalicoccus daliensis]|uniref:Predicted Zn-dependent peptidase n=1 Tax=Alkalicoccus daliensis TaxID=745820 RepID=A0A1H0A8U2_9BACI|nr:pitrilysin family protein [Alkalicoccus daliensis]SDN29644.1 Predicted Zn-dependent peptidase [Alkalicoccus daliensis]
MKKFVLDNGVRVVLEPNSHVRSVSLGIWVNVGSRYETQEEKGMAHFIEHMIFKGTKKRSAKDIAEAFDAVGGYVNAMTSKEYTSYYAKVLDTHAETALDILADMFFNSVFDEEEIRKEKQVVLEEIYMYEDAPDDLVHELLSVSSFGSHPLADPILGTEKTLNSFTKQNLMKFMKKYYGADRVVISVSGNIDETFVETINKYFNGLPKSEGSLKSGYPYFKSEEAIKEKETEQAHFCLGFEGYELADEKMYAAVLLNNILGGNMSSRLFQEVREERGLAYSIFSYHEAFKDTGLLTVYTGTQEKYLEEVYNIIAATIQDISENGILEKELRNAKEQLKGSLLLSMESSSSFMSRNGKNELLLGEHKTIEEVVNRIEEVTMGEIETVSKELLSQQPSISLVSTSGSLPLSLRNRSQKLG